MISKAQKEEDDEKRANSHAELEDRLFKSKDGSAKRRWDRVCEKTLEDWIGNSLKKKIIEWAQRKIVAKSVEGIKFCKR